MRKMLLLAALFLVGCSESPSGPGDPVAGNASRPTAPNARIEHAMKEQERIKAESNNDPKTLEALTYLQEAFAKKRRETDPLTANAWWDEELTGKTPAQIVEKWGPKP
jgi:hypothetical protein